MRMSMPMNRPVFARRSNGQSGPSGCMVHNPGYDFNDAAIPFGASLWVRLVETYLAA